MCNTKGERGWINRNKIMTAFSKNTCCSYPQQQQQQ